MRTRLQRVRDVSDGEKLIWAYMFQRCTLDEPDGGTEEDEVLGAPGNVPLTVVVALTRVEGSARDRDCDACDACNAVGLATLTRDAWL